MTGEVPVPRAMARTMLNRLMSDISERCWCAGWMSGNEFSLWRLMETGGGRYGQDEVTPDEAAQLRALSNTLGEWCVWDETAPGCHAFPSLDDWRRRVERSAP